MIMMYVFMYDFHNIVVNFASSLLWVG